MASWVLLFDTRGHGEVEATAHWSCSPATKLRFCICSVEAETLGVSRGTLLQVTMLWGFATNYGLLMVDTFGEYNLSFRIVQLRCLLSDAKAAYLQTYTNASKWSESLGWLGSGWIPRNHHNSLSEAIDGTGSAWDLLTSSNGGGCFSPSQKRWKFVSPPRMTCHSKTLRLTRWRPPSVHLHQPLRGWRPDCGVPFLKVWGSLDMPPTAEMCLKLLKGFSFIMIRTPLQLICNQTGRKLSYSLTVA